MGAAAVQAVRLAIDVGGVLRHAWLVLWVAATVWVVCLVVRRTRVLRLRRAPWRPPPPRPERERRFHHHAPRARARPHTGSNGGSPRRRHRR